MILFLKTRMAEEKPKNNPTQRVVRIVWRELSGCEKRALGKDGMQRKSRP
jgi:hypothetical protein